MNLVARIRRSLQDGSLPFKALNRISPIKYVPSPEVSIDAFLAEHYPGEGWKTLSSNAKQIWMDLHTIFEKNEIDDITHVGAHDGKMALGMDEAFPNRRFLLIEPAPTTFQHLIDNVSSRPHMRCVNMAAGATNDSLEMFLDNFSAASSILPYTENAIREFPFLGHGEKTRVSVRTLDDILQQYGIERADLLVIDVQGYEDEVLAGARKTLDICRAIMIELSLQNLYIGSSTFDSVYQVLVGKGFRLRHLLNAMRGSGQSILQIDGVFIRE